jgi:aspartyl-tRNA(Asn)/glutamyl-tRNA(Gln) amidotransferase subunit C
MAGDGFDINYIASLARLRLTGEEEARYGPQLARVLAHVEKLGELDVEGIEPTAHAGAVFDIARADQPRPGFTAEEALANAPQRSGDQFVVPKVVE